MITVHYRQGRVASDFAYEHKSYFIIAFIYQLQKKHPVRIFIYYFTSLLAQFLLIEGKKSVKKE